MNIFVINQHQPLWVALVIIAAISIIGYIRYTYYSKMRNTFQAIVMTRYAGQLFREDNLHTKRVSYLLLAVFVFIGGLYFSQLNNRLQFIRPINSHNTLTLFLWFSFILAIVYLIKIVVLKFLGFVTESFSLTNEYIFTMLLTNQMVGILLLPIVVILSYADETIGYFFLLLGALIFFSAFIFRLVRGILISVRKPEANLLYIFLYLCTLEILPIYLYVYTYKYMK